MRVKDTFPKIMNNEKRNVLERVMVGKPDKDSSLGHVFSKVKTVVPVNFLCGYFEIYTLGSPHSLSAVLCLIRTEPIQPI